MMTADNLQPIFVVGTGRSGSTIFFDIFARHPNVAWLSSRAWDHSQSPGLNKFVMNLRGVRYIDELLGDHLGPSEAYRFWDLNCPGFSNPYRDLTAEDVTPIASMRLRESVASTLTRKRNRFLAKFTGWPRVRYLREIFSQARFIEVTREPAATVSSLLLVPFWDGWRGPPNWRRGPLPPDLDALWRREQQSFVALAAIEYVIVQRAMEQCRATLPADQMRAISYSSLCADPVAVFREVAEFCHLEWSGWFEKQIRKAPFANRDDKWRKTLTDAQQATLLRTLEQAQMSRN